MTLPETCIRRPVFATVLSLVILLIGLISYTRLAVREYPRIDEPVVSVNTTYRGASAEVVESQVTKILEDSLAGIEGVEVMTSQSRSETSRINVRFTLKRDPDGAAADVRDKVARVRQKLPDTIDEPVIAKVEADSQPIIYIAVQTGQSALDASDYVKRYIQPRLSVLPGAADVRIFGERQVSMRINLDRTRLAAYRLTVQDVEDAIRRQNAEIPAGRIESQAREFTVVAETDLQTPEQFSNIIVANVGGYPVRVRDIGSAQIGAIDERTISRFNGQSSLNIGVVKQAVANPLDLSNAVRQEVDRMNRSLPTGMKLVVAYDTSVFIDRSIRNVFETIAEAIGLVVLVIFFFLRSLRATVIPIVTIPVSLIGAFGLMYLFGFTINTLTLLVDGARDRPRRRRRDRRAGEHLPPHRGGHPAPGGGDAGRTRDRLRRARDDAHARVGVRAARVRDRAHRAAVHRVRADARRRRARIGLHCAHAVADDVLDPAAPSGAAFVDLQHGRIVDRRADERVPARADVRAPPSLDRHRRLVRHAPLWARRSSCC